MVNKNLYDWWRRQIGLTKGAEAVVGRRKKMLKDIGVDFNLTRVRRALEEKTEEYRSGVRSGIDIMRELKEARARERAARAK